jgi:hypothetical protein
VIKQSLKTDVLSVAILRVAELEKQLREQYSVEDKVETGKTTVGDLLTLYRRRVEQDQELKETTRKYRR